MYPAYKQLYTIICNSWLAFLLRICRYFWYTGSHLCFEFFIQNEKIILKYWVFSSFYPCVYIQYKPSMVRYRFCFFCHASAQMEVSGNLKKKRHCFVCLWFCKFIMNKISFCTGSKSDRTLWRLSPQTFCKHCRSR